MLKQKRTANDAYDCARRADETVNAATQPSNTVKQQRSNAATQQSNAATQQHSNAAT
jgi:hypothetical protein